MTDSQNTITSITPSVGTSNAQTNSYRFDRIFDQSCTTAEVFSVAAQDIVRSCLDGMNGTIFAYGQTSTGKTHTMMGTNGNGVIPMSVQHIFELIAQRNAEAEYLVRVSYLEIYDEQICDLLEPSNKPVVRTEAKSGGEGQSENAESGVTIHGLKEEGVTSSEELLALMREGEKNRRVGSTNMNEESSRSHAIFRIVIESRQRSESVDVRVSMLTLVDLAGSENTMKAGTAGIRAREGQAINKSLLALSNVINALAKGQPYVPYRNSALTRILQPALGGNSRAAIICTIALSPIHRSETHSTLKFASRASSVRNKPVVNVVLDDRAQLIVLRREIQALKDQLKANAAVQEQLILEESMEEVIESNGENTGRVRSAELIRQIEEQEAIRAEQEAKIRRLQAFILNSSNQVSSALESKTNDAKKAALRRGTVCATSFSHWNAPLYEAEPSNANGAATESPPPKAQPSSSLIAHSPYSVQASPSATVSSSEFFALLREKSSIQRQLRQAQERNHQLEEEVSQHTQQTISAMQQREDQILKEISMIFGLEQQVDLTTLKRNLFQFRDYVSQFQQVYMQQTKAVEGANAKIAGQQTTITELKATLAQKDSSLAEREQQMDDLREQLAAAESALTDKEADFAALHESHQEQVKALEARCQEQENEATVLRLRLEQSEQKRVAEVEELKTVIAIDRTARSMQPESPGGGAQSFDRLAKRRQSGSALTRRKSIAPRGAGVEPGMTSHGAMQILQEDLEQMESVTKQLKSANLSLSTENKQLQVEATKLNQQLEGVTKKLRSFEGKHRASLQTIEALQKDKLRLENELKETKRLKNCADKGQEKYKVLHDDLKEEKKAHQRVLDEVRDLTERHQQISQDLATALAINDDQTLRLNALIKEVDQLQGDNERLRQDGLKWQRDFNVQKERLAADAQLQAELQQQIEQHEKKYLALKKTCDDQALLIARDEVKYAQLTHQFDLQKQEHAANLVNLEQLRGTSRLLIEAQSELRRVQGEFDLLQKRYAEGLEPMERSKARIVELEELHQQQFSKILKLEQNMADLQGLTASQLNEAKNNYSRKQTALKEQLEALKNQLQDQEGELLEGRLIIERLRKEIDRLRRESAHAAASRPLSELEPPTGQLAQDRDQLAAELAVLQHRVQSLQVNRSEEATKLSEQLQEKESLIKELKQRLANEMAKPSTSNNLTQEKENPDVSKLRAELTTQKTDIRKYKKRIHDLMSMIKTLQASQIDSLSAMRKIEAERAALQEKLEINHIS